MRLVILAMILGIGGGGYYLAKRGFGRQWRYRVVIMRKHGVEASIGSDVGPVSWACGKKCADFRLQESREYTGPDQRSFARYQLRCAHPHYEPFLNALDVRDARIIFPFKPLAKATTMLRPTCAPMFIFHQNKFT